MVLLFGLLFGQVVFGVDCFWVSLWPYCLRRVCLYTVTVLVGYLLIVGGVAWSFNCLWFVRFFVGCDFLVWVWFGFDLLLAVGGAFVGLIWLVIFGWLWFSVKLLI